MSKASKALKARAATKYPTDPLAQRRRYQYTWRWRRQHYGYTPEVLPIKYWFQVLPGQVFVNTRAVLNTTKVMDPRSSLGRWDWTVPGWKE